MGIYMLKILFGEITNENYIFNPDVFFNNQYEDDWLNDETSRQMVKDIDKSEIVGPHLIESPYLGPISPERLSGGVKTLILMEHDKSHIFNASACGDNCAPWILKLAEDRDVLIRLGYIMDFGNDDFSIKVENTGKTVHSMNELNKEIVENDLLGGIN